MSSVNSLDTANIQLYKYIVILYLLKFCAYLSTLVYLLVIRLYKLNVTFAAMSKMTITEYATLTGVKRDTIHKQLKRGVKLLGVNKIERIGNVNILHVNKDKVK